jgi:hypothetical protein
VNDGRQDLHVNNPNPFSLRWAYNSASNGNVAEIGWLTTERVSFARRGHRAFSP